MRIHLILLGVALIGATAPALSAEPRPKALAKLDRALQGRVAGEPVRCINLHAIRSSRIIDRTAILYETSGGTLYLNRPDAGAASLNDWDVLVTDTRSPQLCDIDVVKLYDRTAWMQTGFVSLGSFVPYRRPANDRP